MNVVFILLEYIHCFFSEKTSKARPRANLGDEKLGSAAAAAARRFQAGTGCG
jgi:hypothetical protein